MMMMMMMMIMIMNQWIQWSSYKVIMPTRMNTGLLILGGSILVADDHHTLMHFGGSGSLLNQGLYPPLLKRCTWIQTSIYRIYPWFFHGFSPSKPPFPENFPTEKPPISREFHPAGATSAGRIQWRQGPGPRGPRGLLSASPVVPFLRWKKRHPCDVLKVPKEQVPPSDVNVGLDSPQ